MSSLGIVKPPMGAVDSEFDELVDGSWVVIGGIGVVDNAGTTVNKIRRCSLEENGCCCISVYQVPAEPAKRCSPIRLNKQCIYVFHIINSYPG